jgi:primosomal protein N' (replication factor Y)
MQAEKPGPSQYPLLIDVAVPLPVYSTYTYRVPDHLRQELSIGQRVLVPFGGRRLTGYVIGLDGQLPSGQSAKSVAEVLDDEALFPAAIVPFFRWVANYYMHPLGEVIQVALPGGLAVHEQTLYHLTETGREVLTRPDTDSAARLCLQRLAQGPCRFSQLRRIRSIGRLTRAMVNGWFAKGWLSRDIVLRHDCTRPKMERFVVPAQGPVDLSGLSAARRRILDLLKGQGPLAMSNLKTQIPTAPSLVRSMLADGQVLEQTCRVYRDPLGEAIAPDQAPELMPEQQQAVEKLGAALGHGFKTFLLAGVTGSGKTEVYLQMAAAALQRSLPVLILVPEIALVSQIERAFRARFGECVAVLHSGLSNGERLDQWRRIQQGQTQITVGARSAIFAPYHRLGLLIVDEEHDDSYKQEGALRYNARDLAVVRGRQNDALVILGSATPSIQSLYNAQIGKFKRIQLFERVDHRMLPDIFIHDLAALKEERGIRRFLTPGLIKAVQETLERKEQVLLFLNRRGFSSILLCAACRQPVRCKHCDISLTYHQQANVFKCHYCGYRRAAASTCDHCGSNKIIRLGMGTEKLEEALHQFFPDARVARMDRDTIGPRGSLLKILKALRQRKIDILVGTQMVAKGHDFPHITLVGIVCADLSLNLPDFRSSERTFQLLAQVAGRAGRGRRSGRVILQTFNPDHFSIQAARNQDYEEFYRQEIQFRKALQYPPFTRLIQIRIQSAEKTSAAEAAQRLGQLGHKLKALHQRYAYVDILGPLEAPLARIANQYRWQLLLKSANAKVLHRLVREMVFHGEARISKGDVTIGLDVDPLYLM